MENKAGTQLCIETTASCLAVISQENTLQGIVTAHNLLHALDDLSDLQIRKMAGN